MSFTFETLPSLIPAIGDAMRSCGAFIRSAHDIDSGLHVKPGEANFVTAYDVEVQRRLEKALGEILPEALFIGEESDENEMNADLAFIVDPIDGTTNFILGYQHSSISVGLRYEGRMVAGLIYNPYLDELFHAVEGHGAYCNDRRLSLTHKPLAQSIVGFGTTPYDRGAAHATFELLETVFSRCLDVRRTASAALDLCYVAAGRTGAFFELRLQPWDYAAGALIVGEAGGVITQPDGRPITLDRACGILAGTPAAHMEMVELCRGYTLKD